MNETWATPKGTKLYLINLKGKPYLPVAERLIWFREEHPDWSIATEFLKLDKDIAIAKAAIIDQSGKAIAMAHKHETKQGFADHIEKAETGAIGRALALCGYGTQFCADEFEEGDRLADAPRNTTPQPQAKDNSSLQSPGDYRMPFGKTKGAKLSELGGAEVSNALAWMKSKAKPEFRDSQMAKEFMFWAEQYLRKSPVDELDQALNEPPMPAPPPWD